MILKRLGVPIYLQVKNYITEKIKSGEFSAGMQIPTERELAQTLGISRNTVSAAYKELLVEGVLEACQGRGTFVRKATAERDAYSGGRRERALKIIDEAMAKVVLLGFSVDQFAAIAGIRAKEKTELVHELRVAIVDDTREYIDHYAAQIGQVAKVAFEAVVVSDIVDGRVPVDLLHACHFVVANAAHQALLAQLMGASNKLVVVSTTPKMEAVIRMARLPTGTAVGIVADSHAFADTLAELLAKNMLEHVNFATYIHHGSQQELQAFVNSKEVLIVAEQYEKLVRQLTNSGQEIIPFTYEIDQGSLNQLVARLMA